MRSDWAHLMDVADLEPLASPCHDCAVTTGFYREVSDRLKQEDCETREAVCKKWFCHNARNRACRGNWDNVLNGPE